MANSKFEYVKSFEQSDTLLANTWIVIRIDGRGFHKLSSRYGFQRPNDRRALDLMNAAAVGAMKDIPDLCLAYGLSDEYRPPNLALSSILAVSYSNGGARKLHALSPPTPGLPTAKLKGLRKLISTVVSTFTAYYIYYWGTYFPSIPLQPPHLPSFDGRAVLYPTARNLRDYMSWRQVDCHINNLYNTTFWAMVQQGGMSNTDAEKELQGTVSADKNEILFKRFGINYNNEPEMFKKGSVVYRQYQLEELRPKEDQTKGEDQGVMNSRSQEERMRKLRQKAKVVIDHVDIIKDEFWERRPWILSNRPGRLPVES